MHVELTDAELDGEWELLTEMHCFQIIERDHFQFLAFAFYNLGGDFNPSVYSIVQLWVQ